MHLLENTYHFLHWKIQIFKVKFDKRNHTFLVRFHNSTIPWEHEICTIRGPLSCSLQKSLSCNHYQHYQQSQEVMGIFLKNRLF